MATQQWKHHVFISFRGEDTRYNFVCHLDKDLSDRGLKTFVDNQLRRGEEIHTALLQAIQDSKVALIIFSENYASSSWCLDELLKIIECYETHDQIVIPVFYRVTPSDVRRQNGRFGESFAKHSENPRYSNKIQKWKDVLTKVANISGWDSDVIREEDKLIDLIVRDVLDKLKHPSPYSLEGFVGLKSKISQVKTLLATGSSYVRILGIRGMGGIGKTTIAETIFDEVSSQFEGRCFVRNVREVSEEKDGILKLLEQLISDLLKDRDVKIHTKTIGRPLRERLKSKRVFVVFDDVSDRLQLEELTGNQSWFGAGSNIIITSRDKKVFKEITDNIFEVEALSYTKSRQLFERNAFKEKQPSQDHIPLIDSFVNYASGNPLAIIVLGSYVCGEGVELWKDALIKLSNCPNEKIHDVLKLSYDGLDREEKVIFLHIACFFKGEKEYEAKRIFTSCGLSADIGVSRLVDKSLVTISKHGRLEMHDLLQEMGREIVRQESEYPRRRSRLWNAEEILGVFEENEGTEAIETQIITFNTSQIRDDIVLDPNVFKRMPNLKVLRFYTSYGKRSKLHLTKGLRFLPSGLRYLHWAGYSLESLPTGFHAKELRVLNLPESNIKQILEEVKVRTSSCPFFSRITSLDMSYCKNLKSFSNNVDLKYLEILNLYGCSNLKIFPEISTNLRALDVGDTAIKEVHSSSIEGLSRLQELDMHYCKKLESLPSNICKLQALQELNLGFCSSLKKFPEITEPMYNLRKVFLSCSGIEALPSSIDNMKGLEILDMSYCLNLACLPESFVNFMRGIDNFELSTACKQRKRPYRVTNLEDVRCLIFRISCGKYFEPKVTIDEGRIEYEMTSHVSKCISYLVDLPSHPCLRFSSPYSSFFSLCYILNLSSCQIRKLPKDLGSLYYLRKLNLSFNYIVEIPASIKQLSLLESLRLDYCPKLRSLPQLPTSLCRLSAAHCESLKTLLAFKQPIFNGGKMDLSHSLKLVKEECEAMAYKMLSTGPVDVRLNYSGNRIPEWFRHQTIGDIIRIKLPSNWFFNRRFFGFAFCVVSNSDLIPFSKKYVDFECYFEDNYNPTIRFTCQTKFSLGDADCDAVMQQHVLVWCLLDFNVWISERRHLFGHHCMASFKFFHRGNEVKITKCGITPLYMQDDDGEAEYDDDENAYRMLQSSLLTEMSTDENAYRMLRSSLLTEMSTDEDDEEDMNSGDADEVCSSTSEDDEEDMNSGDADGDADEVCSSTSEDDEEDMNSGDADEVCSSTNEDDEEDMNSGDADGDADEVCFLRLGSQFISQPLRTPRRDLGQIDLEQTEMFHELTEKRKERVEAGSKIKRMRQAEERDWLSLGKSEATF